MPFAAVTSCLFFFFFQAEDGIRDGDEDWSSDVCSSDLPFFLPPPWILFLPSAASDPVCSVLLKTFAFPVFFHFPDFFLFLPVPSAAALLIRNRTDRKSVV